MDPIRRQSGAALIWATFAITVMGVMAAVAFNIGHLASVRGELRNAADAGALAGVMELDGTQAALSDAVAIAAEQAGGHSSDRYPVSIDPGDVELGRWAWNEPSATAFHPVEAIEAQYPGQPSEVARRVTAVRVRTQRAQMPYVFPGLVGRAGAPVGAEAVAAGGGPCQAACPLPFTIADCDLESRCGQILYLRASPAPSDLMAFTVLSGDQATSPDVNEILRDIIAGNCQVHGQGEMIHVNNGNFFNPIEDDFVALIAAQPPEGYWIPITGGYDCSNPQFVQEHSIEGFGRVRLERIVVQGSDKHIEVRYLCDIHDPGRGGCIYYGTHARPMLVR